MTFVKSFRWSWFLLKKNIDAGVYQCINVSISPGIVTDLHPWRGHTPCSPLWPSYHAITLSHNHTMTCGLHEGRVSAKLHDLCRGCVVFRTRIIKLYLVCGVVCCPLFVLAESTMMALPRTVLYSRHVARDRFGSCCTLSPSSPIRPKGAPFRFSIFAINWSCMIFSLIVLFGVCSRMVDALTKKDWRRGKERRGQERREQESRGEWRREGGREETPSIVGGMLIELDEEEEVMTS